MRRFQYYRILTGVPHLKIWNRSMECTIECTSRVAFLALIKQWNRVSKDWAFLIRE